MLQVKSWPGATVRFINLEGRKYTLYSLNLSKKSILIDKGDILMAKDKGKKEVKKPKQVKA